MRVRFKDGLIEILGKLPKLDEVGLAKVVGMMGRTAQGLERAKGESALTSLAKSAGIAPPSAEALQMTAWNAGVVADAICAAYKDLNWDEAMKKLDQPEFGCPSALLAASDVRCVLSGDWEELPGEDVVRGAVG